MIKNIDKKSAAPAKIIALGANTDSKWGKPPQTIRKTIEALQKYNIKIIRKSPIIVTQPYGYKRQNEFHNAVVFIQTSRSPLSLMRVLNNIEKNVNRKYRKKWGPRNIDLDLIAYNNYCNWTKKRVKRLESIFLRGARPTDEYICVPHYEAHKRKFVLEPICMVSRFWHHPLRCHSAAQLVKKLNR